MYIYTTIPVPKISYDNIMKCILLLLYINIIDIIEKIRSVLDKGIFACSVYVDLQKAFNMVNYSILWTNVNTTESEFYLKCGLKVF